MSESCTAKLTTHPQLAEEDFQRQWVIGNRLLADLGERIQKDRLLPAVASQPVPQSCPVWWRIMLAPALCLPAGAGEERGASPDEWPRLVSFFSAPQISHKAELN
jgi:hypothetical protein